MTFSRAATRRLTWFSLLFSAVSNAAPRSRQVEAVPQCTGVTLSAAYLAQVTPTEGPGFLLIISNNTDQPIKLAKPFPTSAHWYAQAGQGKWLWRASTGSGGALVNALAERGPLLAYAPPATFATALPTAAQPSNAKPTEYLIVPAKSKLEVAESMRSSPILRFRPGCERCKNPGDERYRAVLAYAYLPGPQEQGLLPCGLRSGPIVMPPLE